MNNRYKIEYLPVAEDDLTEILQYIHRDNPSAAWKVLERIEKVVAQLASFPNMGKPPHNNWLARLGYLHISIDKYSVFYIINEDVVEVHGIVNAQRDYKFLVERVTQSGGRSL